MATKRIVTEEFTDDLDGGRAEGTVRFSFNGATYDIDLSKKNRLAMEKAFKPYIDSARKARPVTQTRTRKPSSTRSTKSAKRNVSDIREWAAANGHEVSSRGRISQKIVDAFEAAQA